MKYGMNIELDIEFGSEFQMKFRSKTIKAMINALQFMFCIPSDPKYGHKDNKFAVDWLEIVYMEDKGDRKATNYIPE